MRQSDVGLVVPVSRDIAGRIFAKKGDVFVKNVPQSPRNPSEYRLKKGMKVIFYLSGSNREISGEAEVEMVEFLDTTEALQRYHERLVLDEEEFKAYANASKIRGRPLLVITLGNPKKYPVGVKYPKRISLAGEYLSRETYIALTSEASPLGASSQPTR